MDTPTTRQNCNPSKKRSRQINHKLLKVNYNLPQSVQAATQMEFMIMNFYDYFYQITRAEHTC